MQIKAAEVNSLRKKTGAGMMDCKKALVEANGDLEKAVEILRKKGQKIAANRADRESMEGVVLSFVNEAKNKGVVISLNCETDFVAKNEDFINLATELSQLAVNYNSLEEFNNATYKDGITVEKKLIEQIGVIGEKIEVKSFKVVEAPFVGSYIHPGNQIATLVGLSKGVADAAEAAKNVAMQVAAMNPIALDGDSVDASIVEKEVEIAKEQLRKEGKPEAMLDNIAKGKIKRFFKDNTLLNQDYIKDNKQSVIQYVQSIDKELTVTAFERVSLAS